MYFLVTLSLVALFIHKLIQVYRNLNQREYNQETEFLMEPITKVTILCSISLIVTLINVLFCFAWIMMGYSAVLGKFCNYTGTMDLYTNFICILFCNKMFKSRYLMICSGLDKKCRECWKKIVNIEEGDNHPYISDNLPTRQMTLHWGLSSNSTVSKDDIDLDLADNPDVQSNV